MGKERRARVKAGFKKVFSWIWGIIKDPLKKKAIALAKSKLRK